VCVSFIKTHCDSWDKLGKARYRCYMAQLLHEVCHSSHPTFIPVHGTFPFSHISLFSYPICVNDSRALPLYFFHIASIFLSIGTQFIFQFYVSRGLFCDTLCLSLGMSTFCFMKSIPPVMYRHGVLTSRFSQCEGVSFSPLPYCCYLQQVMLSGVWS